MMIKHFTPIILACVCWQVVAFGQEENRQTTSVETAIKDTLKISLKHGQIKTLKDGKRQYIDSKNNIIKEYIEINQYHPLSTQYGLNLRNDSNNDLEKYSFSLLKENKKIQILKNLQKPIPIQQVGFIGYLNGNNPREDFSIYNIYFFNKRNDKILADKTIIEYIDNQKNEIKYIETSSALFDIGIDDNDKYIYGNHIKSSNEEGVEDKLDGLSIYSLESQKLWLTLNFSSIIQTDNVSVNKLEYLSNHFYYLELCDFEPFKEENSNKYKKIIIDIDNKIMYEQETNGCTLEPYVVEVKGDNIFYNFMKSEDYSENFKKTFKQIKL